MKLKQFAEKSYELNGVAMINLKPEKLNIFKIKILSGTLFFVLYVFCGISGALPIFPGAQGFGAETTAGRGGTIYKVTNLNASGSGSLKDCINKSGPRVCVFEVSGTIKSTSQHTITNPYITIAGQTAPSPGITIRGAALGIETHDVLVQHIRIRIGDESGPSCKDRDGIALESHNTYNVVLDHVSVSWATDENIQIYGIGNHDITVSNSITSEALFNSCHPDGCHSMGLLVAHVKDVAIINNLFAHDGSRNPQLGNGDYTSMFVSNNVIYNWDSIGTRSNDNGNNKYAGILNNVYIRGNDTNPYSPYSSKSQPIKIQCGPNQHIYVNGNMHEGNVPSDPWDIVGIGGNCNPKENSSPLWPSGYEAMSVNQVKNYVLRNAGARPADRDTVDTRIINDVAQGTGSMIDSQNEVGGWPNLAENYRQLTIPNNPNSDNDGDGYTNLEEWLHQYAAEVEGGSAPSY